MSLIESMIAVAISVLIAMLVFPSMDRALESTQQTGAATTLMANMRVARAQAVRRGASVTLTIAPDGQAYTVGDTSVQVPDRLKLTARPARLTFYADGSATGGYLTLTGTKMERTFQIKPATGIVVQDTAS